MKITVKALKRIGRYRPGDVFQLSRADAKTFALLGVAEPVDLTEPEAKPEPVPAARETAALQAEDAPPRRRRAYRRRDLQAEE